MLEDAYEFGLISERHEVKLVKRMESKYAKPLISEQEIECDFEEKEIIEKSRNDAS